MKRLFGLIFILMTFSIMFLSCKNIDDNVIVVMSYNVRVFSLEDNFKGVGLKIRSPLMKEKIDSYSPDIIGMQEVNKGHMEYFESVYKDIYDNVIEYRSDSSVIELPEATPIFYKKDKFELLDSGTFWLSQTPDLMSIGWDANRLRICTYVKLKIRKTGKIIYFYNTHLDFGKISVPKSIELILERMELNYPNVLVGDFNFTPTSVHYSTITQHLEESKILAGNTSSITTFNNYSQEIGCQIDYCYLSKGHFKVDKFIVADDDMDRFNTFASDHYPIIVHFELK